MTNGSTVIFRVQDPYPVVRVNGCVQFGGNLIIDESGLPTNTTSTTLMIFNCYSGKFNSIQFQGSKECETTSAIYLPNSFAITHTVDCPIPNTSSVLQWLIWVAIAVCGVIVILGVFFAVARFRRREKVLDLEYRALHLG